MNPFERRDSIRDLIAKSHTLEVGALAETLHVSEATVRRDLALLERQGVLRRLHGGAAVPDALGGARPYNLKRALMAEEKRRIGRKAAEMIGPGERVIIDSGTTALEVARNLRVGSRDETITVITGSLPVLDLLGHREGFELVVIGGLFVPRYETVVGPQASRFLQGLNADKFIMATDGVTLDHGATTDHPLEAEVMETMAKCAREVIVVADSSKIGHAGFVTVLGLCDIHRWVTDTQAPTEFVEQVKELGVEVILA